MRPSGADARCTDLRRWYAMRPIPESSPAARFNRAVRKHPLAAFLLILYPVSWVLFLPALLGTEGFGVIGVDVPAQVGILLMTIFGLTGVAFVVTRIADGKTGTGSLRRHYYQFKAAPQWYLLALLGARLLRGAGENPDDLGLQLHPRQPAGGGAAACVDRHDRVGSGAARVLSCS